MSNKSNNLPAKNSNGQVSTQPAAQVDELLNEYSSYSDDNFKEVKAGEFLELFEGEQINAIFTGFEQINDMEDKDKIREAAVLWTSESDKKLATQTVLVNMLRKIPKPDQGGVVVRITNLGKPAGKKYYDYKVLWL